MREKKGIHMRKPIVPYLRAFPCAYLRLAQCVRGWAGGWKFAFHYHQKCAPTPFSLPFNPLFNATIRLKYVEFNHKQNGQPAAPLPSIKYAKQVVKFATSTLSSEKSKGVPRPACCFPLGAWKVFNAFPK